MLTKVDSESTGLGLDFDCAAGKGVVDGMFKRFAVANLEDCLKRRRQIGPLVVEHWSECADLRYAYRRGNVCSESLIESPGANELPDGKHLRGTLWIRDRSKHAI